MMLIILASSVELALDSPRVAPGSAMARVLFGLDVAFTSLFTSEMALKILAKGLLLHQVGPGAWRPAVGHAASIRCASAAP
jgi:hypothetical protein